MYRDIIKRAKESSGLTIQEIADRSGVSTSTINRLLAGTTENPNFDNLCAILAAYGFPIENIFTSGGHPDPVPEQSLLMIFDKREEALTAPYKHQLDLLQKDVDHLTDALTYRRKMCNIGFGVAIGLMAFICTILIIDLTNTNVGWFRGMYNTFSQMFNGGSALL